MSLRRLARRLSPARRDEGASLVIVLVIVMAVGLVVTSLLGYAQTGITSAAATKSRHSLAADTSAALDAAITTVRYSDYANQSAATACPADGLVVPGAEASVRIVCSPRPGSGVSAGTVPITALNRPGSAVLTLGTSASETGLNKASNAPLRIKGRVWINSDVVVSGSACASLSDTGCSRVEVIDSQLFARTGCPLDKVFSTPAPNCAATGTPPESKDPATLTNTDIPPDAATGNPGGAAIAAGYAQPASALAQLPLQIVPSSCPSTTVVELYPGYYDDAGPLTSLTSTCNKTVHFNPGVYFFDFRNEEVAAMSSSLRPFPTTGSSGSSTNVWTINNNSANFYLVGGTPKDWNASGPTAFPGSCVSPLNTTTANQGVQFVFGGSSRMEIAKGRVELCGQYATDKPALTIYGATSSTSPAPAGTGDVTAVTATTPIPGSTGHQSFSAVTEARAAGGAVATVTINRPGGSAKSASMRLTGANLAAGIPAGSIVTSAKLRVVHREATTQSGDAVALTFKPNPTRATPLPPTASPTLTLNSGAGLRTDVFDIYSGDLVKEVWRYGLADMQLDYTATASSKVTNPTPGPANFSAEVDGIQLVLEWKAPSVRSQSTPVAGSNCVSTVAGCALIRVPTGGNDVFLYVQGTTYAPKASFDLQMTNVSGQVFRSGIIARALSMQVTPSTTFFGPLIEVPDENGSGVSVDVYLTAYRCPATGTCASAAISSLGAPVGRASVELESVYPVPTSGNRAVRVKTWNVQD